MTRKIIDKMESTKRFIKHHENLFISEKEESKYLAIE